MDAAKASPQRGGRLLDRALDASAGSVVALALFSMMWLTLADILSRKFGAHSIHGATEITEILLVTVIFGALPLVSWHREHVMLDTLERWLGPRAKAIRHAALHVANALVFGVLAWLLLRRGLRLLEDGDTTSNLKLPIAPVAMAMCLCLLATGLVHLLMVFLVPPAAESVEGEP